MQTFNELLEDIKPINDGCIFDALMGIGKYRYIHEKEIIKIVLDYLNKKDDNGNFNKIEVNKRYHLSLKRSKILQKLLKPGKVKISRPAYSRAWPCETVNMYPAGTTVRNTYIILNQDNE